MPRPNEPRAIYSEAGLARRVAYERQRLDMSLDGLAKRMSDAGCPIHASAIYKIEKGDPPRRITVDELVAFSMVFDVPITDLLLPPEAVANNQIKLLFEEWVRRWQEAAVALVEADRASQQQDDAHKRLMAVVLATESQEAKRYFLDLLDSSPLATTAEERKAMEKADREAVKALAKAEATVGAIEKRKARRG